MKSIIYSVFTIYIAREHYVSRNRKTGIFWTTTTALLPLPWRH